MGAGAKAAKAGATSRTGVLAGPSPAKVVAYLSAEFLTGPHLGNSLVKLGPWDAAREAASSVGQELETLVEHEEEPGLAMADSAASPPATCIDSTMAACVDAASVMTRQLDAALIVVSAASGRPARARHFGIEWAKSRGLVAPGQHAVLLADHVGDRADVGAVLAGTVS